MHGHFCLIATSFVLVLVALFFAVAGQQRSASSGLVPAVFNSEIDETRYGA
jgi:hypothetical protein